MVLSYLLCQVLVWTIDSVFTVGIDDMRLNRYIFIQILSVDVIFYVFTIHHEFLFESFRRGVTMSTQMYWLLLGIIKYFAILSMNW